MDLELTRNQAKRLARAAMLSIPFREAMGLILDLPVLRDSSESHDPGYLPGLFIAIGEGLKKPEPQEQPAAEPTAP